MTASEPILLLALAAVPVLALLAVAAARPRNLVVSGLHLWQRVHSGTARTRRRWLTPAELALLVAATLAILGAVDPGWLEPSNQAPDQPSIDFQPKIQSAAVDGHWLFLRLAEQTSASLALRPFVNGKLGPELASTPPSRGVEFVFQLPGQGATDAPLVVTSSEGSDLLGLWPEPPVVIENKALTSTSFAALLDALEGVAAPGQSTANLALLGPNDSSELPRLVFLPSPADEAPREVEATIAAAQGWEELASNPEFAAAAAKSNGLGEDHKSAEPLIWIRLGDKRLTIAAIHRNRRELAVALDIAGRNATAAWIPHLMALGIRELGFRDVLDPARFRLFWTPAKDSRPYLPLGDPQIGQNAGSVPGLYLDGVVNLPTRDELRGQKPTESAQKTAPSVVPLGWIPLLLSGALLLWYAFSTLAQMESARRAVASQAGA